MKKEMNTSNFRRAGRDPRAVSIARWPPYRCGWKAIRGCSEFAYFGPEGSFEGVKTYLCTLTVLPLTKSHPQQARGHYEARRSCGINYSEFLLDKNYIIISKIKPARLFQAMFHWLLDQWGKDEVDFKLWCDALLQSSIKGSEAKFAPFAAKSFLNLGNPWRERQFRILQDGIIIRQFRIKFRLRPLTGTEIWRSSESPRDV